MLISGFVSVDILVANTALVNLLNILYLFIYATMHSSAPMIGNKVGEGDKEGVIKLIKAVIAFGIVFSVTMFVFLLLFSRFIFTIYANNTATQDNMTMIMPIFMLTLF